MKAICRFTFPEGTDKVIVETAIASAILMGAMRASLASCMQTGVAQSPISACLGRSTGISGISNAGRSPWR